MKVPAMFTSHRCTVCTLRTICALLVSAFALLHVAPREVLSEPCPEPDSISTTTTTAVWPPPNNQYIWMGDVPLSHRMSRPAHLLQSLDF